METKGNEMPTLEELQTQKQLIAQEVANAHEKKQNKIKGGVDEIEGIRKGQVEVMSILEQAQKNLEYYESLEKRGLLDDKSTVNSAKKAVEMINSLLSEGNKKAAELMNVKEIGERVHAEALEIHEKRENMEKLKQEFENWMKSAEQSFESSREKEKVEVETTQKLRSSKNELGSMISETKYGSAFSDFLNLIDECYRNQQPLDPNEINVELDRIAKEAGLLGFKLRGLVDRVRNSEAMGYILSNFNEYKSIVNGGYCGEHLRGLTVFRRECGSLKDEYKKLENFAHASHISYELLLLRSKAIEDMEDKALKESLDRFFKYERES